MYSRIKVSGSLFLSCAVLCSALLPSAFGQTGNQASPSTQQDEVLRISTDLVQTDVLVLDKQGRAVTGLAREQFELIVEGLPQPIAFFESVEAGSAQEMNRIAATRGATGNAPNAKSSIGGSNPDFGRSFIFYVDDLHLAPESLNRTRSLLTNFVNKMGANDQALIFSPTGQIGFLQQLTDNKTALRRAVARLNYQAQAVVSGSGRRGMTVYEAQAIERGQRSILDYKVKETMDDMGLQRSGNESSGTPDITPPPPVQTNPPGSGGGGGGNTGAPPAGGSAAGTRVGGTDMLNRRMSAELFVKNEARRIVQQSSSINQGLFSSLEFVARGSASLPGRKLIFFISDGFVLDTRSSDIAERLNRVIDTAARSGVAIYTLDSKGLTVGTPDASKDTFNDIADLTGGLDAGTDATSVSLSANSAEQEILRTLAADTGGRAIFNRNDLKAGLDQILKETAAYYVVAWKPQPQQIAAGKPKFNTLQIKLKDRPDLRVLARKGFYSTAPPPLADNHKSSVTTAVTAAAATKISETELRAAVSSPFPRRQMHVAAYSAFSNEGPGGYKVTSFVDLAGYQTAPGAAATAGGKAGGEVDLVIVTLNDTGKSVSSVGQKINIPASEAGAKPFRVVATLPNKLEPGLYQVRVAARDAHVGQIGSFFQWLEVPEFKIGKLALSNLLLAENTGKAGESMALEVDRRFARASSMLVQCFVYNAAPSANNGAPDATVTLQVFQNGQQLIASPPQPIPTANVADMTRLQYGSEFPLSGFPPGRYLLQVTVNDRAAQTSASQQLNFTIE